MKPARLVIAAFLFAIASGLLWWLNKKESSTPKSMASTDSTKILELKQEEIRNLALDKTGSERIELKREGGKWSITAPKPLGADQDAVSSMLSTFSSLSSDRLVEDKATNLDQYGLAHPSLSVSAMQQNGKTVKLLFGDATPAGTGSYAELANDQRVFIVANYSKSAFEKSVSDLRDKRLLAFETEKLTRIELTAKKQSIEFGRTKDQWQIVKPKPARADQSAVDELVRSLHDAKMDLSPALDDKKLTAAFNSATPLATARITDVSGTQELQVRKAKDDSYAKSSLVAGIYKVSASTVTPLDKALDDFRNKKLFEFGFVDPDKVELFDNGKQHLLARANGDWWSNGTKIDSEAVNSLLSRIRDLSATKFPDSGFAVPLLDITVISNEAKRTEKALISKNGDRYIAKREGEPALYELDPTAINDLRNAVDGLKPAPAPPPAPAKK